MWQRHVVLVLCLLVASTCAVSAGAILYGFGAALERLTTNDQAPVKVVMAARDLPIGVPIEPEDLVTVSRPPAWVTTRALWNADEVVGRVPRERILRHEQIRPERLADPSVAPGLAAVVPRGLRAESLNIDGAQQVSGFVSPGAHVDVIVTLPAADGGHETRTLIEGARVLAVNDDPSSFGVRPRGHVRRRHVTLQLTPQQAEAATHADTVGRVHLTLRGDIDFHRRGRTQVLSQK